MFGASASTSSSVGQTRSRQTPLSLVPAGHSKHALHTRSEVAVDSSKVSRHSDRGAQIVSRAALQGCTSYSAELQAVQAAQVRSASPTSGNPN